MVECNQSILRLFFQAINKFLDYFKIFSKKNDETLILFNLINYFYF